MRNIWIWVVVAIVVIGGLWWFMSMNPEAPVDTGANTPAVTPPTPTPSPTPATSTGSAPMTATITYDGTKFTPSQVTIKKGGTVTWTNSSGGQMWVASANHPSHTVYSGTTRDAHCPDTSKTAFDECAGSTGNYSFKFDKAGSWGFHDHLNASAFGKVTVVE